MRRPLVAVVAVIAAMAAISAGTVAVMAGSPRTDAPGYGMSAMMSSSLWGQPGWRSDWPGSMHGFATATESEYLATMVRHHEEAVAAAEQLQRSDRASMRAFGESIVETQTAQIDQMNTWLSRWYPGRAADVDYQPMMRDLSSLSGDSLDRAFLQDMIGHHMMAVMMSQQLLVRGHADHEEVDRLAMTIREEQHAEIVQMRRWLTDWFDATWDAPPGWGMGRGMGPWMMR
jgi:uncharacterized protein (DUF305 family)